MDSQNKRIVISKKFSIDCAHRLLNSYTTKCQNVHGHSYGIQLFLSVDYDEFQLNHSDGVVEDFGFIKEVFKEEIEDKFDHKAILQKGDPLIFDCDKDDVYIMKTPPTAEQMAILFYNLLKPKLKLLTKVRIFETATSWAQFPE